MRLSISMIVKNEAQILNRCLSSVNDLADEIVIVDTGSEDKTLSIAEEYTDKIYHYNWDNNFSKARNYSLSKCNGEWILALDADELINEETKNKIRERIYNSDIEGYKCIIRNIYKIKELSKDIIDDFSKINPKNPNSIKYFNSYQYRLFKNGYMYNGNVFEVIGIPKNKKKEDSDIIIFHQSNYNKDKTNNYLRLGLDSLKNNEIEFSIYLNLLKVAINERNPVFKKLYHQGKEKFGVSNKLVELRKLYCIKNKRYKAFLNEIEDENLFDYFLNDRLFIAYLYYKTKNNEKSKQIINEFIRGE